MSLTTLNSLQLRDKKYYRAIKQKLKLLKKFLSRIIYTSTERLLNIGDTEWRSNNNSSLLAEFDKIQSLIETKCPKDQCNFNYS